MKASFIILVVFSSVAFGDWQYRSRPDLSPPRLNITISAGKDVAPGYLFVTPYPGFAGPRGGPEQQAGYIFRDDGDLVWSSLGHLAGLVANLQAVHYQGKPALQAYQGVVDPLHGHGFGSPVILDQHYRQIAKVEPLDHRLLDLHEFRIVNGKSALFDIYQPIPYDLSPWGGTKQQQWIVDGIIQEVDIATGEVEFEVNTLSFASPEESIQPLKNGDTPVGLDSFDAWDYIHVNSVDKDEEGNYLISGRHTSTIYKINGQNGSVIWRLGGKSSDFKISRELEFGWQHDARFHYKSADGQIEVISLFDNGAGSPNIKPGGGYDRVQPYSSGRVYQINHTDHTVTQLNRFVPPDNITAFSQGNAQLLPNGNYFINWGQAGAVSEFRANDSDAIFHAYLDSDILSHGVQSYRGFRFEWEGHSSETPAIVALHDEAAHEITIYVSWNGDTVTKAWEFYLVSAVEGKTKTSRLGQRTRASFETSFTFAADALRDDLSDYRVFAVALDRAERHLQTSASVPWRQAIAPAGLIDEALTRDFGRVEVDESKTRLDVESLDLETEEL